MKAPKRIEIDSADLHQILERSTMTDDDRATMQAAVDTLAYMTQELERSRVSVGRMKRVVFGARTEKTRNVVGASSDESQSPSSAAAAAAADAGAAGAPAPKAKRKGHGRNGANAYRGAEQIPVAHASLRAGAPCPACETGKLYELQVPSRIVRITGRAPILGKIYELDRLRCNTCGEVFTAAPPEDMGDQKYDITTAVIIAMIKYGVGTPFYRLARLQHAVGIPMPPGTQWKVLYSNIAGPEAVFVELTRQAAQGDLLHNDDTTAKVLAFLRKKTESALADKTESAPADKTKAKSRERTGVFTSSIVSVKGELRIALYFTGRQHAGENLADVLRHRAAGLDTPIHMCDALSRNLPKEFATILCNCLTHGRRGFVDAYEKFPDECRHVLVTLRDVYYFDDLARTQSLSADARLAWHQKHSAPVMLGLEKWMKTQFEEKIIEPNSGLGDAIKYMQKHWQKLTQFLRVPGAPLDNTIAERAIKRAILHRKNALFFRTQRGAHVGDIFLSIIHTAELCAANPVAYIEALMTHAALVVACPSQWMPWNYQLALAVAA